MIAKFQSVSNLFQRQRVCLAWNRSYQPWPIRSGQTCLLAGGLLRLHI